jgi:hypothetical protein
MMVPCRTADTTGWYAGEADADPTTATLGMHAIRTMAGRIDLPVTMIPLLWAFICLMC